MIFFTEADVVVRFQNYLAAVDSFNQRPTTADGHVVTLIHREYPTFFRFSDSRPTKRLWPPAKRGHYDTVILNPEFVKTHNSKRLANRDIHAYRDESITPFLAVVEFKFHTLGWGKNRVQSVIAEFGKLKLSMPEVPLRHLVVLTRYRASTLNRWRKHWPTVKKAAEKYRGVVNSIFAVNWLIDVDIQEKHLFGDWVVASSSGEKKHWH